MTLLIIGHDLTDLEGISPRWFTVYQCVTQGYLPSMIRDVGTELDEQDFEPFDIISISPVIVDHIWPLTPSGNWILNGKLEDFIDKLPAAIHGYISDLVYHPATLTESAFPTLLVCYFICCLTSSESTKPTQRCHYSEYVPYVLRQKKSVLVTQSKQSLPNVSDHEYYILIGFQGCQSQLRNTSLVSLPVPHLMIHCNVCGHL